MTTDAEHGPVTIRLEICRGAEPIQGRLLDCDGTRSFRGWIELTAALEAARVLPGRGPEAGRRGADDR